MSPFVLGVVGDSGSGKHTVADAVRALLGPERVADVRLDDYHRFTREERAQRGLTALNPVVHNFPLMREHLQLLRQGRPIRNRGYNHADGTFDAIRTIEPREVVLVRGLLGYPSEELRSLYHLAIFLQPEAELLFRWKLRRDVLSRGYTEAEVLKSIAAHLLDSKEYVLPQAERADVLVRYELPNWEAPDSEVRAILLLRRSAAECARRCALLDDVEGQLATEHREGELEIRGAEGLSQAAVERWARRHFPGSFSPDRIGVYVDEDGAPRFRSHLAFVEVLIARLTEAMGEREVAPGAGVG